MSVVDRINAEFNRIEREAAALHKKLDEVEAQRDQAIKERDHWEAQTMKWRREYGAQFDRAEKAEHELAELRALLNTPHIADFLEAVRVEAVHQRERWGVDHDAGKTDADWFWLIGYLAGKAIRPDASREKKLHHIITTAAACLNWHAHTTGADTRMRPGIEPPKEPSDG